MYPYGHTSGEADASGEAQVPRTLPPLSQFDAIPIAVFAADHEGAIYYTNQRFDQIIASNNCATDYCRNLGELEDLMSIELALPAYRAMEQRIPFNSEQFIFTGSDGQYFLLSISLSPLITDGACWGVFGVLQDVTQVADASESLRRRIKELNTIEEISQALHSTMKTDDILRIILTGATCKEGLGFNRAFLFLLNEHNMVLEGQMAIGPSNAEEAGRIWGAIEPGTRTLSQVLAHYLLNVANQDIEVNHIVRSLKIDLSSATIFRRVVQTGRWCNIDSESQNVVHDTEVLRILNTHRFAIVPLLARGKTIGTIVADNLITGKPIDNNTVRLLQIFADHAATAIEKARLFEEIEIKAESLERANSKLEQVQKQIAAIEKSSLMAEITHKIAHELRNPITIIGGFAALLNRGLNPADKLSEYGRIIVDETLRVEKALEDVLNFSKSFAQDREACDLREIVQATTDVLEQTHSHIEMRLDPPVEDYPLMIRVNRDQTVQSLRDIIEAVGSFMPDNTPLRLSLRDDSAMRRIELHWQIPGIERQRITELLTDMLESRTSGSSLRLTLAFETVRYNGGEPGLAARSADDQYLFIEYPSLEE